MIESYDRPLAISNSVSSNNCPTNEYSHRTASNSVIVDQKLEVVKKIICRYGRGCTHMHDACHRLKFWHPTMPALTAEQLRTHYVCNECGVATASLDKLQLHLQRKTAWSNKSLIGCRISCLVDFKEWHEGQVTQYHRSGKHYVEFRAIGEKRWLNMKKIVFYIVERPVYSSDSSGEFKDDQIFENSGLAPIEDKWMYCDDISLDYAFAQSVLFKIYGKTVQETGHKTKGHVCLTDNDKDNARNNKGSLLYGELLPRGANKAFGDDHLAAANASVLFDLGMGAGKVAVQAFVQFRNLKYVYGVELSLGRYNLAEDAVLRMIRLLGAELFTVKILKNQSIVVTERMTSAEMNESDYNDDECSSSNMYNQMDMDSNQLYDKFTCETKCEEANDTAQRYRTSDDFKNGILRSETDINHNNKSNKPSSRKCKGRVLKLEFGNMFDVKDIHTADIVMLETDIPQELQADLCALLSNMKPDSRTLTYLDLRKTWCSNSFFPYRQLENNKNLSDRFPTSWSVQRGHHFYVWTKICTAPSNHSSGTYLASQIKSLCPSSLNCEKSQSSGLAAGSTVPARSSADDEARKKQDSAPGRTQPSTEFPLRYGQKLRGGKSQLVTGRCLPFSFSNSIRSMFTTTDLNAVKSQYSLPNGNSNGSVSGSGSGSTISICGNGGNSSLKDDIPQKDNTGSQPLNGLDGVGGSCSVGNRTAGLLTPRRWSSPTVRRATEDLMDINYHLTSPQCEKVIPLNIDTSRASNPPVVTVAVSPVENIISENTTPFGEIRNAVARSTSKQDCLTPPIPWAKVSQRSKSCSDKFSNNFEKGLSDAMSVASRERGSERGKESSTEILKVAQELHLGRGNDLDVDAEQSWYTLGHTMDRSRYSNRDDAGKPSLHDNEKGNEIDSSESDLLGPDEFVRGDDDYNTNHRSHGSLFLDKSTSHTRFHDACGKHKSSVPGGNTWSTSASMKKSILEKDSQNQAGFLSSDAASSYSDSSVEGIIVTSNGSSKIFQSVSCLSFDGSTESHRVSGVGSSVGVFNSGGGGDHNQKSGTSISTNSPVDGISVKVTQVPSKVNRSSSGKLSANSASSNSDSINKHSSTGERQQGVKHNEMFVKGQGQVKVMPQESSSSSSSSSSGCVIN